MPRPFWQVVEDPEYIEDWDTYYLDEEDRMRGIQCRDSSETGRLVESKINSKYDHDSRFCNSKFFD
jgi:hypothetical protein